MKFNNIHKNIVLCVMLMLGVFTTAIASSHREAPLISNDPLADNVDLYAFKSPDNPDMITVIATYVPFQLPHGGPNYYSFGENIRYEIHVDNDAAVAGDEITYRFTFHITNEDPSTFFYIRAGLQNQKVTYTLERSINGGATFETIVTDGYVPPNNIGPRSINSAVGLNTTYEQLFQQGITSASTGETVFAGPTDDPFFVDLAGVFDLGDAPRQNGKSVDNLACYNVSAIAIQIPISTLLKAGAPAEPTTILDSDYVIGVWASASRQAVTTLSTEANPTYEGDWIQVSRLGMPLTNEAVIAIGDKDYWNSITPYDEISETTLDEYFYNPELALYMDEDQFGSAVPAFSPLRIQTASLGAFDFSNGADGLFGLKGSAAVEGTALDDAIFGTLLLPAPGKPRSVDLWPAFHTGVPNVRPYHLATGKNGDPLAAGKPFVNNFLPNGGDMLRLNMAVPATSRTDAAFSTLGLINAAVLGLTDPTYANIDLQFIPNMDGFPNGRRLEDDVTRIELQAVGGVVLAAIGLWYDDYDPMTSPSPVTEDLLGVLGYTTGIEANDRSFTGTFPYLAMPFSGTGDCSGEIQNNDNPVVIDSADYKLFVSTNNGSQIGVLELKDGATEMNLAAIANADADGIYYNEDTDVLYQLDRTNNVINAYNDAYAAISAGSPLTVSVTSTSDFINGREIAVSGNKLVVAQDANDGNGMVNKFVVYTITSSAIVFDKSIDSPINLWGIHLVGSDLYAIEDNSSNVAFFDNLLGTTGPTATVTQSINVSGIVRTHGLTYEAANDIMILTDIGAASSADDGAFVFVNNFTAAASDNEISSDEQIRVGGDLTNLGNPVDIAFDSDLNMVFVAERANEGGRILGFNTPTENGNFAPEYNELFGGASAVYLSDCVNAEAGNGNVVYFDLDACRSYSSDGSANDFSEFEATYPESIDCGTFSSTNVFRNNPDVNGHSCTEGVDGDPAMCVGSDENCSFTSDSDKAVRFSMTVNPISGESVEVSGMSFYEKGPDTFDWINGDSGPNNYPTKYGVRILANGVEIFSDSEVATTLDWTLEEYDFTGLAGFTVSESTVFDFELLGYCPVGNGAVMSAWDLDEINISASCVDDPMKSFMISGNVKTEDGIGVSDILMRNEGLDVIEYPITTFSDVLGAYVFDSNPEGYNYILNGSKNTDYLNGITTLDIVLIQKHILALEVLDSPYKMIAADVNNDSQINGVDMIQLRKLLLGRYADDVLPKNGSWKFIDGNQELDFNSVWSHNETMSVSNLTSNEVRNFTAVKIGDINSSAQNNFGSSEIDNRTDEALEFAVDNQELKRGETYRIALRANNFEEIAGFQFTLNALNAEILNIQPAALNISEGNYTHIDNNTVTMSWNTVGNVSYSADDVLFWLELKAVKNGSISQELLINNSTITAEAYAGSNLNIVNAEIQFRSNTDNESVFVLYQNQPNPFKNETNIQFILPTEGEASLTIYDVDGKIIKKVTREYTSGLNSEIINFDEFGGQSGVYYYVLETNSNKAVKKLVLIK